MLEKQKLDEPLGQHKPCNHGKATDEQGGWQVAGLVSQDFHYDGSSTMNVDEEEDQSPYDLIDERVGSEAFASAKSRFSSLGLSSLISSLISSPSNAQLEEPVHYEPTTISTVTYFGPFVFFSSFTELTSPSQQSLSTSYYTGEYVDEYDEDDLYVESDESIAYYFQGIYDSNYAYEDSTSVSSEDSSSTHTRFEGVQIPLILLVLAVGALWYLIMGFRSYLELRKVMLRCQLSCEGNGVTYPVTVQRNGKMFQGYVVLPYDEEPGKAEEGLFVSGAKEMQPVVVAKDLI